METLPFEILEIFIKKERNLAFVSHLTFECYQENREELEVHWFVNNMVKFPLFKINIIKALRNKYKWNIFRDVRNIMANAIKYKKDDLIKYLISISKDFNKLSRKIKNRIATKNLHTSIKYYPTIIDSLYGKGFIYLSLEQRLIRATNYESFSLIYDYYKLKKSEPNMIWTFYLQNNLNLEHLFIKNVPYDKNNLYDMIIEKSKELYKGHYRKYIGFLNIIDKENVCKFINSSLFLSLNDRLTIRGIHCLEHKRFFMNLSLDDAIIESEEYYMRMRCMVLHFRNRCSQVTIPSYRKEGFNRVADELETYLTRF